MYAFFRLAAVAPNRQRSFRTLVFAHIILPFDIFSYFSIINCNFALHSLKIVSKFLEKSPKQKSQGLRKKSQGPKVRSKAPRSWDKTQSVVTLAITANTL